MNRLLSIQLGGQAVVSIGIPKPKPEEKTLMKTVSGTVKLVPEFWHLVKKLDLAVASKYKYV